MPSETPQARTAAPRASAATTAQPPRRPGLVLAVIAMAQLMVVLDLTIVVVALPHMQAALGFSGTNGRQAPPGRWPARRAARRARTRAARR